MGGRSQESAERNSAEPPRWKRWLRFVVGVIALSGSAGIIMSGSTPPGVLGDVVRHNQNRQIDASPLFYSEVENMNHLEAGVEARRKAAALRQVGDTSLAAPGESITMELEISKAN